MQTSNAVRALAKVAREKLYRYWDKYPECNHNFDNTKYKFPLASLEEYENVLNYLIDNPNVFRLAHNFSLTEDVKYLLKYHAGIEAWEKQYVF